MRRATWSIKVTFSVWLTIFDLISNSDGIMIAPIIKTLLVSLQSQLISQAYCSCSSLLCHIDHLLLPSNIFPSILNTTNTNVIQTWYSSPEIKETMSTVQIVSISNVQWVLMRITIYSEILLTNFFYTSVI